MAEGSILTGDYTLHAFITHCLFTNFMATLDKWKCKWTYGPTRFQDFQKKIVKNGLTILEDRDLLNTAGPFLTWVRDSYMTWIPNYRCYVACKGGGNFKSDNNKNRLKASKVKPV